MTGCARVPPCLTKEVLGGGYDTCQGKGKESCIETMHKSNYERMLPVRLMFKGVNQSCLSASCWCFTRGSIWSWHLELSPEVVDLCET